MTTINNFDRQAVKNRILTAANQLKVESVSPSASISSEPKPKSHAFKEEFNKAMRNMIVNHKQD